MYIYIYMFVCHVSYERARPVMTEKKQHTHTPYRNLPGQWVRRRRRRQVPEDVPYAAACISPSYAYRYRAVYNIHILIFRAYVCWAREFRTVDFWKELRLGNAVGRKHPAAKAPRCVGHDDGCARRFIHCVRAVESGADTCCTPFLPIFRTQCFSFGFTTSDPGCLEITPSVYTFARTPHVGTCRKMIVFEKMHFSFRFL